LGKSEKSKTVRGRRHTSQGKQEKNRASLGRGQTSGELENQPTNPVRRSQKVRVRGAHEISPRKGNKRAQGSGFRAREVYGQSQPTRRVIYLCGRTGLYKKSGIGQAKGSAPDERRKRKSD